MKASEFCYWLQGYFEISDYNRINERQIKIIAKHLDLVTKYEEFNGKEPCSTFIDWLHGFLQPYISNNLMGTINAFDIQKKLNDIFLHEIDNSYGNVMGLQQILNNIHGNEGGEKMRC